jgi:hypothetical protein
VIVTGCGQKEVNLKLVPVELQIREFAGVLICLVEQCCKALGSGEVFEASCKYRQSGKLGIDIG